MICQNYINSYITSTIKQNEGILEELELFAKANHIPIIQPEVANLIKILGSILKPRRILEIGTAIGYSAIILSSVLQSGGKIDTIEIHGDRVNQARDNIKRAGLEQTINVISGDAAEVLECLQNKYDMVFLDAAKGQYMEFLPHCLRLLEKNGLLVSDNVLYKGMVANDNLVPRRKKTIVRRLREYINCICNNELLETSIIPLGDGIAVSYRK